MGELIEGKFPKNNKKETISRRLNIESFIFVLETVTNLIKKISGNINGNIYKAYIKQVSVYTDEELIGWINNASELQIKDKPLFFRAIIDISKQRDFFPKKNKLEDDKK